MVILLYNLYIFLMQHGYFSNTVFAFDPSNSVIKRLWCSRFLVSHNLLIGSLWLNRFSKSCFPLLHFSSLRRNSKKKKAQYPPPIQSQKYNEPDYDEDYRRQSFEENPRLMQGDYRPQPQPRFRREIQDDYRQFSKDDYRRQSFEDAPHPLEDSYGHRGSRNYGKQNGLAYANPIMEDEDDVVPAQYVQNNYSYAQQPSGGKLPPLERAEPKKKKKKKFLKKMAHHHDEDEDL